MVDATTEAASISIEGQSMHAESCEEIFRYTCWQPSTTLHKATAAKDKPGKLHPIF